MGFFRCPINHELVDAGIEQEWVLVIEPAKEICVCNLFQNFSEFKCYEQPKRKHLFSRSTCVSWVAA